MLFVTDTVRGTVVRIISVPVAEPYEKRNIMKYELNPKRAPKEP
jgi:hypothetical protein